MSALDPVPRPPALVVEGFTRRYGDELAVDGLSFEVRRGEILGLVGPNGAGKTTTLRSIVGVLPLQEGRIEVDGCDLAADPVEAKRRLAWVPDDPQPIDSLTVDEHLEVTAELYGVEGWRERREELLERFTLVEKRRALGGELSRGMRQKLAFACAWLSAPRLVLMDEPLSGLDPLGIRAAKEAIRELAADGVAVVLSSHLLELIEQTAERILILHRGRRVFLGTLAEARASELAREGAGLEEIFLAATDARRPDDSTR